MDLIVSVPVFTLLIYLLDNHLHEIVSLGLTLTVCVFIQTETVLNMHYI